MLAEIAKIKPVMANYNAVYNQLNESFMPVNKVAGQIAKCEHLIAEEGFK